jgi:hypothetical protein
MVNKCKRKPNGQSRIENPETKKQIGTIKANKLKR